MASDNPELDVQKQQFRQLQDQFNKVADQSPPSQYQYIKLPDGQYGKFRNNTSDAEIRAQIEKDYPGAFSVQPQRTGGQPGAPDMQAQSSGMLGAVKRGGQYLQEHVVQPVHDVAQMASEDIKSAIIPGYKKQPDPENALNSLAAVGGTALFPVASVGTLVGGTIGAASQVSGAQTIGEILGGLGAGGPQLKSAIKKLFTNKEQQLEKFTKDFLQTPEALKANILKLIPGFKDQPITFAKQIGEPMANDAKALLNIAKANQTRIPTIDIRKLATDALTEEAGKGLKSEQALKTLRGLEKDIPQGTATYSELDDIVHTLNSKAEDMVSGLKKDTKGAQKLRELANSIVDRLDQVSPAARAGNALYRQDKLAIEILQNLRTGNIVKVENALLENHTIAERFGWNTDAKVQAAIAQLKKIKATPSQGAMMLALQKFGGSGLLAYALHRGIFDFVFSGHGR